MSLRYRRNELLNRKNALPRFTAYKEKLLDDPLILVENPGRQIADAEIDLIYDQR
jgi:hypothetical protein